MSKRIALVFTLVLPLFASAATLTISVTPTDKSTPLPCRIHLENRAGEAILPDTYPAFKTYFTCEGTATLSLPPGSYTYAIEKGPEFTRASGTVNIEDNTPATISATLQRIAYMAAEGWWSGDLHVHRPPEDMEVLMRAEDLHIAPVITWWNKKNLWRDTPLPANPLVRFDGNRYYHLMAGEDERDGGAFNFFGLDSPVDITAGERFYPCQAHYIPKARRRGAWVELEKPFWWDAPIGIGLGFVDSIGIANNHMWRHGMLDNEAWGRPRCHESSPAAHANGIWTQEIYYHVLNAGLRIPPSAGSASGVIPNAVGYNRVYVQLDEPLDYDAWWEGLRAGRSFVTNGPLLRVRADGELPGHVFRASANEPLIIPLIGELDSNDPVSTVQIVKNGRVVQELPTDKFTDESAASTITFTESGWFLVRAIADVDHTFRFASTAPFYVEIGDTPRTVRRESVAFFLDWIDERDARIDVPEAQRTDIMVYHDKARAFWEGLLAEAVEIGNHTSEHAATALDYAEQRTAFLERVEPLFGSRAKRRSVLYRMVVESLDKESVPFLRELLQDESYKARWIEIGRMIAWLSDSDDEESVSALIAFIRRPNTWPTDDRDSILDDAVGKGAVLQALGLFESDIVSETLRDAFTEEGAAELIAPWVSIQTTVEPLYLAFILRSWAAQGLVLTRDPENIALVRDSYEALAHKMLTAEYREKEMTDEMWLDSERHLAFMGAMTDNDMLSEMGVEEFVRLRDNSEKWARTTLRFASKYWGSYLDDERTVMEQCPLCGITSEQ